eukprot:4495225-Pyramimonas_sp.AAC.1
MRSRSEKLALAFWLTFRPPRSRDETRYGVLGAASVLTRFQPSQTQKQVARMPWLLHRKEGVGAERERWL